MIPILFGCTKSQQLTQDEINAEAEILAKDKGIEIEKAIETVGAAYRINRDTITWLNCSDSDPITQYTNNLDGRNIYEFGIVNLIYSYNEEETITYLVEDTCSKDNNNILIEYYCKGKRLSKSNETCTYGCLNGACIPKGIIQASSSPPEAEIYIDNIHKGTTPITIDAIDSGNRQVKFTKSGYKDYITTTYIYPEHTINIHANLTLI